MGKKTLAVKTGNLIIGGGFPVTVQTMWKKPLSLPDRSLIEELGLYQKNGCDIIRFAVPKLEDAEIVGAIAEESPMPVVCDVHFDYRIALRCMDFPVAKLRINPGTIGAEWKVREIASRALDRGLPIRIGINAGSLPSNLEKEPDTADAMVKAAEEEIEILEKLGFSQIVVSIKSQDVFTTIRANETFASLHEYPLHLGVTEAGPLIHGVIKNTIALSTLLSKGIGDTVRISLSDSSLNEIHAGIILLGILGLKKKGIGIVSCPMCSRSGFNVGEFVKSLSERLPQRDKDMTIAVMGCPVNGPGEAKNASLGITGAGKYAVIFKEGKILRRVRIEDALEEFVKEIEKF